MHDYGLGSEDWFGSMYEIREMWIPAYCLDLPMGGLIKTTSISESVNSFFGKYTRHYANLVEFFMHFDNAIESQRHANARLNELEKSSLHELRTHLLIEKHALSIYTNSIFKDVQDEIFDGCYNSRILKMEIQGEEQKQVVGNREPLKFTVTFNERDATYTCGCKRFNRAGLICSHMFAVFKNDGLEKIPEKYVTWRWSKQSYARPEHTDVEEVPQEAIQVDERKIKLNRLNSKFHDVLALIEGAGVEVLDHVLKELTDLEAGIQRIGGSSLHMPSKVDVFERFFGRKLPQEITVLPPQNVKAKGSGSRIKSRREKEAQKAKKPLRKCSRCKQMSRYDARNCKAELEANNSETESEGESDMESQ